MFEKQFYVHMGNKTLKHNSTSQQITVQWHYRLFTGYIKTKLEGHKLKRTGWLILRGLFSGAYMGLIFKGAYA